MKNKFSKIISSLLIVAFLISSLSVFAFASEDLAEGETDTSNLLVLYNRNFEEGWDIDNGMKVSNKGHNFTIDKEETTDYSYNYFTRFEATTNSDGYAEFNFGVDVAKEAKTFIDISIKLDDIGDVGKIMYAQTGSAQSIDLLSIEGGHLYAMPSNGRIDLGALSNDWTHVSLAMDWEQENFTCVISLSADGVNYTDIDTVSFPLTQAGDKGLKYIRIGLPSTTGTAGAERNGMSFCVDNFRVYQGVTGRVNDISNQTKYGVGSKINTLADKTITIDKGAGVKTMAQVLEESLCLKLGVEYALFKNERRPIYDGTYGAPMISEKGNIMIPLEILLSYMGLPYYIHPDNESFDITTGTTATYITAGRDVATVGDTRIPLAEAPGFASSPDGTSKYLVIAMEDIEALFPGWLVAYDDMGLIVIYEDVTPDNKEDNEDIVSRDKNLSTMVDLMKKFVFDVKTSDKLQDAYNSTGSMVYEDVKKYTNDFQHPYIIANQDIFDKLKAYYNLAEGAEGYNAEVAEYITKLVTSAIEEYTERADVDTNGVYQGIKDGMVPVNPYKDGKNPDPTITGDTTIADTGDGYDPVSGQLQVAYENASILPTIAMAYNITGNENLLRFAYDWMIAMSAWDHWGPGYFVNTAETAAAMAIAYDWLYNGMVSLDLDTAPIADAIYKNGIHDGYVSSTGSSCEHPRNLGDQSSYNTSTTNINAVGSAGMILATLATFDYLSLEANTSMMQEAIYLVGDNLTNLGLYGLDQYAPDGSYIESPTYWVYGTNYLFRMIMGLISSTGKDYGYMDAWGLDKTCYYAIYIESSDGFIWNYHDGGSDGWTTGELASMDTSVFSFVGQYYGDKDLVSLRQKHLKEGRSVTVFDLIFYPFDGYNEKVELPLDYEMEGIEAYVSRSDWESGAMYTGIMGGQNNCSHGQIDSGNFIYYNKGISWIMDLGSENYNVYDYFGSSRYKYYRVTSEGQNVVVMTSEPTDLAYGQYSDSSGEIVNTYVNEHGTYAILDNTEVYLNFASHARRGLLVTNDRETVVIQDEMSFTKIQTVYWVAHTAAKIELDESEKVAYLTAMGPDGQEYTLRATLVTNTKSFKFTILQAEGQLLSSTNSKGYSESMGGQPEYGRNGIQRLAVQGDTALSFNVSVVFEIVESKDDTKPVGYKWTTMNMWDPTAKEDTTDTENQVRDKAEQINIRTATNKAKTILEDKLSAFSTKLSDLYDALTLVEYTLKTFTPENLDTALSLSYSEYLDCKDIYDDYLAYMNKIAGDSYNMVLKIHGTPVEAPATGQ